MYDKSRNGRSPDITHDELRSAIEKNELFLEYLPTIRLDNLTCVGAEALVRWRHDGKVIPPLDFVTRLEGSPDAGTLTYWVIDRIGAEIGPWLRAHKDIHIGVNIPPSVFGRGAIAYVAEKANLLDLASQFVLEITERGMPDQLGIEEIRLAHAGGVRIALDDVVSSDLSLVVLARSRVDILKLDKSLVEDIEREGISGGTFQDLQVLARGSKVTIIAEGVERREQAELLRSAGVTLAQGWLFSKPLSAADFFDYSDIHGTAG